MATKKRPLSGDNSIAKKACNSENKKQTFEKWQLPPIKAVFKIPKKSQVIRCGECVTCSAPDCLQCISCNSAVNGNGKYLCYRLQMR